MKKTTKIWLVIASVLVFTGFILFAAVMTTLGWDFKKLTTVKYETNTYELSKTFESISIDTNTADIVFKLSDDEKCRVKCYENVKANHSVDVKNGVLTVDVEDKRTWIDNIQLDFNSPCITIFLPETDYTSLQIDNNTGDIKITDDFRFTNAEINVSTGDIGFYASCDESIKIKTTTGDIHTEHITAGSLDIDVTTGKVVVSDVNCEGDITADVTTGKVYLTDIISCRNIESEGSTGNITLNNVNVKEKISVGRSTGDVKLDRSDAAEIYVRTDTGDVAGSLLTDKIFFAETDTGDIDVPESVEGGKCKIKTDTGDISIKIEK